MKTFSEISFLVLLAVVFIFFHTFFDEHSGSLLVVVTAFYASIVFFQLQEQKKEREDMKKEIFYQSIYDHLIMSWLYDLGKLRNENVLVGKPLDIDSSAFKSLYFSLFEKIDDPLIFGLLDLIRVYNSQFSDGVLTEVNGDFRDCGLCILDMLTDLLDSWVYKWHIVLNEEKSFVGLR